jgi:hypothetical protein
VKGRKEVAVVACSDVRPVLDRYLDGEADRECREAVDRHLATCAECRQALAERRRASELLREWSREPAGSEAAAAGRGARVAVRFLVAAAAGLLVAALCLAQHSQGPSAGGDKSAVPVATAGHQLHMRTLGDGGVQVVPGKAGEPAELIVEAFPLKWRSLSSGVQVIPGKAGEAAELVVDPFPEEGK